MRGRAEQIAETAKCERTDGVAIITGQQIAIAILIREDVEMVLPEINHYFVQLPFAVDGAQKFGALQVSYNHLWILRRRGWLGCGGTRLLRITRHGCGRLLSLLSF